MSEKTAAGGGLGRWTLHGMVWRGRSKGWGKGPSRQKTCGFQDEVSKKRSVATRVVRQGAEYSQG